MSSGLLRIRPGQTTAPTIPPGASRSLDVHWPQTLYPGVQAGAGAPTTVRLRGGSNGPQAALQANTGAGTSFLLAERLGSICANLHTAAVAGALCRLTMPYVLQPTLQPYAGPVLQDGSNSSRAVAQLSFPNPAGAIGQYDYGLCLAWNNNTVPFVNGGAFIGLYCTGPGQISLLARAVDAGALTLNVQVQPAGFDVTQWHEYELRVVGATNSGPAQLKAFIDGALVATYAFDGVTLPNKWQTSGNAPYPGLSAQLLNGVVAGADMWARCCEVHAGPSEVALL